MTFQRWFDNSGLSERDREAAEKGWNAHIESLGTKYAFLVPAKYGICGARYKYLKFFETLPDSETKLFWEAHFQTAKRWVPSRLVIFGDRWGSYRLAQENKFPYILCEHDVVTMRETGLTYAKSERTKIKGAEKIIFTSPDHQKYIVNRYNVDPKKTMVLYLRPSKEDLDFEPLPKLPGKNIVYVGGLMDKAETNHKFGYRSYGRIFKAFIDNGWNVHLYPIRKAPEEYAAMGCIYHETVPEGKELYREISQFTAGLQTFNRIGVPDQAYKYAMTCRPNKLWNYLGGGIPTIGFQGGNGMKMYEGKWGIILDDLANIKGIEKKFKDLDIEKYRKEQVIESQKEELIEFLER